LFGGVCSAASVRRRLFGGGFPLRQRNTRTLDLLNKFYWRVSARLFGVACV